MNIEPIIETKHLIIRPFVSEDSEAFQKLVALTLDETKTLIRKYLLSYEDNLFGIWAVIEKKKGVFLGSCGLSLRLVNEEKHIVLSHNLSRGVYAKEACIAVKDYAFAVLGIPEFFYLDSKKELAEELEMEFLQEIRYNHHLTNLFRMIAPQKDR